MTTNHSNRIRIDPNYFSKTTKGNTTDVTKPAKRNHLLAVNVSLRSKSGTIKTRAASCKINRLQLVPYQVVLVKTLNIQNYLADSWFSIMAKFSLIQQPISFFFSEKHDIFCKS
jgi:hypothetical protein